MFLLTGATGFTGSYVLNLLLEKRYPVTCFVRKTSNVQNLLQKNVRLVYGDLSDYGSVVKALVGTDTLINLASLGLGYAPNIVNACKEVGVKRTIFISTTGIFTKLNPDSKRIRLEAEDLIRDSGLDYTILRPTMIYGTHQDRNMCRLISFIAKNRIVPILGSGGFLQQPVYVNDLARAIVLALEKSTSIKKEYNVAGGKELTYNEVVDIVARFLNRKIFKIHIPLFFCIWLLGLYERISKKPRLKREQALRLNENKKFSIEVIEEDLGYTALTFEEGARLQIQEMKKQKLL